MPQKDLLIEIGLEEIPARFLDGILSDCSKKTRMLLDENRLPPAGVEVTGTMRRIIVSAKGIPEKQADITREIKGPPRSFALDEKGGYTKAALGFASSQGVETGSLSFKDLNGTEYLYAEKKEKGKAAKAVLSDLIPKLLSSLYLPVSMKWGEEDIVFIRPLHYILAVFGDATVPCGYGKIKASDKTKAHRFIHDNSFVTYKGSSDIGEYKAFLSKLGVVPSAEERKSLIKEQIAKFESKNKAEVHSDQALLDETSNLVENPVVLAGNFNKKFIGTLPEEVIATVVKKQQKCFPVKNSGFFLIVADGRDRKEIVSGYEQVVNARLSDAKFFFDEDIKRPLSDNVEKLKKITYHEKIGSMRDKSLRMKELSKYICSDVLKNDEMTKTVERICELAKADLPSHMVGEFSGLAGVMGREYALASGEDRDVATGIFEHYLPRFPGDAVPEGIYGAVAGIADRIDSIAGCFRAGLIPSGSEDPYALRRAAQGIVSIILAKELQIPLDGLIGRALELYGQNDKKTAPQISDFIMLRMKAVLENEGVRYDIADSVLKSSAYLTKVYCKAFALMKTAGEEWMNGVVKAADRISRIIAGAMPVPLDNSKFVEQGEKDLYAGYAGVNEKFSPMMASGDYEGALKALSGLSVPLEKFFDDILVMHKDDIIKNNRLALLKAIGDMYLEFADLQKIVS